MATGFDDSWWQQLWLASLAAGPNAAVSGRAAAAALGYRSVPSGHVEVAVQTRDGRRSQTGRVRTTFWLPPEHVVVVNGLRVTSAARTLFDLAGDPPWPAGRRYPERRELHKRWIARRMNEGIASCGLTMTAIVAVVASLGHRGVSGTTIMRELTHEFGLRYVPAESGLEYAFVELLESAEVEQPERQVNISDETGWIGRVDFLYRRLRLVIEIDGPDHDGPLSRAADEERDRRLRAAGYQVLRIPWWRLVDEPAAVLRELLAILTPSF